MYNVNVIKNMDLGFEDAGNLVAQVLQVDFEFICKEVRELQNKLLSNKQLENHELEDLKNNREMRDAMKSLLRYYMTHRDYVEFMELQRVYGNVD